MAKKESNVENNVAVAKAKESAALKSKDVEAEEKPKETTVEFLASLAAVLVTGLVLPEESGPPKISVQEIVALDNARVDLPAVVSIRVWLGRNGSVDRAKALEELFRRKPGPTQVRLRLELPRDFAVLLDVPAKVRPDREFRAALEAICGAECIETVAG